MKVNITIIIEGGCLRDVIGVDQYTLIDCDNLKEQGMTTDQIDMEIDRAKHEAKADTPGKTLVDDQNLLLMNQAIEGAEAMVPLFKALQAASQAVIDSWEKGDLAGAVRRLDQALNDSIIK